MGAPWSHDRYCDAVELEISRLAGAAREADLAAPVPTCPGWDVATLVRHIGGVHRWAGGMVAARSERRLGLRDLGVKFPEDPADLLPWFAEGGAELLRALRSTDPGTPVWTWGADQRVGFWSRRMLQETVVHRCDAELALGREPVIEPDVADDGIDELVGNLSYAAAFTPKIKELAGDGETLAFSAADTGGRWSFRLTPEGFTEGPGAAAGDPGAAVDAAAGDLYLFLWGRRKLGDPRLAISGDEALLIRWVEHTAI
ncbi:maleylpyruvate isomerase family mycothiol-dependent enzyme [Spirillospora sp. NPDC048911]|uniref:maleylpyruvate isomerase family mycothiol-dependent enzyme n=1 Tax=Spirillospora sp. NPDC048911 TaxID=3364527 RepID=UPI00371D3A36